MQRVIDWFLPNNCRQSLHRAASTNSTACRDTVCLLRENRQKLADRLSHHKAA